MIVLFKTVRDVMKADAICRTTGVETVIIPVPEKISGQCGMCLRMDKSVIIRFKEVMANSKIEYRIYEQ